MRIGIFATLAFLALVACKDEESAALPEASMLTEEAMGYYCQMNLLAHEGPKAQAHLAGQEFPLWFSQVRDGVAYLKSPEQSAEIRVIYVNDMGEAESWAEPGIDNWINAVDAFYVVGSSAIGGMGAPELVPFSERAEAEKYAGEHGGEIMQLGDIPMEMVLSPVDTSPMDMEEMGMTPMDMEKMDGNP
ncbi:MAG: nitrous oxide reductase accessory protein NosL [Rhodobacteraceae bacterium]|nr:nitrous oxide reductase accessory protein NosL [Paracoccaceae bacterium]